MSNEIIRAINTLLFFTVAMLLVGLALFNPLVRASIVEFFADGHRVMWYATALVAISAIFTASMLASDFLGMRINHLTIGKISRQVMLRDKGGMK